MSGRLEIQWTPTKNKFITWGTDSIYLYEVKSLQEATNYVCKISNTHCADVFACTSNQHYVKTLDIYPKPDKDLLLALGLCNGKIVLSTFGYSEWDAKGFPGKELVPRHPRQCNSVLFNPTEPNLLATGLDKYKADSCILIYDINQLSAIENTVTNSFAPNAVELIKPVIEYGSSESCQSMAWFHGNTRVFAAGMNWKNIRLFDIRDHQKVIGSNLTKAANGVCTNPRDDRYLASYTDNQIYLWDTRNIEKPIWTLSHSKALLRIGWCPTKNNLLCALQKDSTILSLYDIQHPIVGNEEVEPSVLERVINPASPHQITSFSWHPAEENRILIIALSGAITDYMIFDRITLNWSPVSDVVWSCGRKTMKYVDDTRLCQHVQDISIKMKDRAKTKYGLEDELFKNAKMVENDEILSNVWNWLHLSSKLIDDGKIYGTNYRHPGVLSVLKLDDTNASETITVTWEELGHPNCSGSARYFKRDDRSKALHLCSWPVNRDSTSLMTFIDNLSREKAYTRAAAIAVFNLKVQYAIDVLSKASLSTEYGSLMNVVAMALSGFSDDPNSAWKSFCTNSIPKLTDPYLKVMFAFLTAENYNYDSILNEPGIAIDDRVAFACMFLPDSKLSDFMKKLSENLCNQGNLDGLLLTGNSPQGLKLLQKYLDVTGDIQSTTLIAVRAFHNDICKATISNWIENYQNLLNTWRFWFERAEFDLMVLKHKNEKPPQQIYISCSYCGKSISSHFKLKREQYSRMTGTGTQNKLSACPNCRKPMPRCTICLMNMGTTIADSESTKPTDFDNWFTWCQHCRHGGHSKHMIKWFEDHVECPTTGCSCRCFSLDYIAARSK